MRKYKLNVVISDLHVPFHSERVVELINNVIDDLKPDGIIVAGDAIDFYQISKFPDMNNRHESIQSDINQTKQLLADFKRISPNSSCKFIIGNHEERLTKYLATKASALKNLDCLTIDSLLELNKIGYKVYDGCKDVVMLNDLNIIHGWDVRKHAGYTAKNLLDSLGQSVMMGHCHRLASISKTLGDRTIYGYEIGHCSDVDKLDYTHKGENWQNGFAIVHTIGSTNHSAQLISLVGARAMIGDKIYSSYDVINNNSGGNE